MTIEARGCGSIVRRHTRSSARQNGHLSQLGLEVTASRLRALGHPVRLRIVQELDASSKSIEQLAGTLALEAGVVGAHVRLLLRVGVLCQHEQPGPATFQLADWPSLWLVEQFARRLRVQAGTLACDTEGEEEGACE